ncbi:transcriptional regulator, TetR family [Streptoalloteichus tenebrarius]|uniref:Transcriptional regulator, TetR family n=1 Tax=Streptoalloteichus tenebrarius (strain ATCC 17920 / DSM 40477 / JCM 4838 / CBS 697.72 / NBRC 16177 / NCIMB 11028 / NRRL B-12390 / A12253. 1 / ISP 5477) TaxID=1933 RepID=A0ABT1HVN4_STRSD|nr:TetR/AcrR family transcriptional regulator [Streptoalloteichus tenebrarius]MCP2259584.1 transcriptional regulator, TetR family [Streptoalloteichus tenebrarius]BFF01009.1 TetR/AcrR family transcriptional regulator [Streptoalloteichus tenebrarius]
MTGRRGRPRSAAVDWAVEQATLDLLARVGYHGLTIEAVAARAGVGRPTVYRRWPTKDDLVVDVLSRAVPVLADPDTGDALRDLELLASEVLERLVAAGVGPVVLAVLGAAVDRPELASRLEERYLSPRLGVLGEVIARGVRTGRVRDDLDVTVIRDLVLGPLVYRVLLSGRVWDRAERAAATAAVRRAIAAPGVAEDAPPSPAGKPVTAPPRRRRRASSPS